MDIKTTRLLNLLDEQFNGCKKCILCNNGFVKPYWTEFSKYIMIGESPDELEVKDNKFFVGEKGKRLWNIMSSEGFTKRQFAIFNTVHCRVVNKDNKTGKPSELHRKMCKEWIRKYFKILKPEKILLFGNFAINSFLGEWGLDNFYKNDKLKSVENIFGEDVTVIRSVHPGSLIYEPWREEQLRKSIRLLKDK